MKKVLSILAGAAMFAPLMAFGSVDITLVGGVVTVPQGDAYVEPGYSAFSSFDGDITNQVAVTSVNTNMAGTFSVDYSVTDSNQDSANASRMVNVMGVGAGPLYCSGPLAAGWQTGLPDGGCGTHLNPGQEDCPLWIGRMGCTKK